MANKRSNFLSSSNLILILELHLNKSWSVDWLVILWIWFLVPCSSFLLSIKKKALFVTETLHYPSLVTVQIFVLRARQAVSSKPAAAWGIHTAKAYIRILTIKALPKPTSLTTFVLHQSLLENKTIQRQTSRLITIKINPNFSSWRISGVQELLQGHRHIREVVFVIPREQFY